MSQAVHETHELQAPVGRPKGKPTRPVRLHEDVAELAEMISPAFKESVPDFLSNILRPILEAKRKEAASIITGKPKGKAQDA